MTTNFKSFKDASAKIDGAAGTIVDLTACTNQASIQGTLNLMKSNVFGVSNDTNQPGTSAGQYTLNGYINSTSGGVWRPLVGNRTSITKTAGFSDGLKWLTGEFWPTQVTISGNEGQLQTWSATLVADGALSTTSVAPA